MIARSRRTRRNDTKFTGAAVHRTTYFSQLNQLQQHYVIFSTILSCPTAIITIAIKPINAPRHIFTSYISDHLNNTIAFLAYKKAQTAIPTRSWSNMKYLVVFLVVFLAVSIKISPPKSNTPDCRSLSRSPLTRVMVAVPVPVAASAVDLEPVQVLV
jgi:hypothetical protein